MKKRSLLPSLIFSWGGVIFLLALLTSCPGSPDIKIHTVTFDLGYAGALQPEKIEIEDGSVLSPVEAPTRDGYRFDGWYLKGSNVKYDFSLPVVSNIVLEAHWTASSTPTPPPTPTSYTVTYHAMVDGVESDTITVPEPSTVQSGSMLQVPAKPTYDNPEYFFVGWSTSGTEYVALASDHVVQGNLDLWAVFVKKSSTGTTAGGMLSYTFDEAKGGYTITGTTSATGAIVIPSTINGAPVVEILAGAFKDNTSITSIDLSGATNLKTIGNVAFGFTNIKELTIPGNVETVGRWIVEGCSLTIEEGVKTLSESSFYGAAVKTIKIPSTITDIPAYCFEDSAIESIELHNGITSIGDAAFMNCSNLTALTIPGSVTHIGQWILQIGDWVSSDNWIPNPNTSITVTIEEGATGLSSEAFWGAPISTISIPSTIKEIPELCFASSSVKEVTTTGSIKTISDMAFLSATDLASFDLTGVETIGMHAFAHTGIKSIHIPASVNKIGSYAFENGETKIGSGYKFDAGDSLTVTFEEGFNGLATESFYGAPISTITIPKSVTEIPKSCFNNATLLTSVTLHDDITEIMDYAFYDAEIEEIQLPTGLTKIGSYAFADNALTSLTLPDGLTSIGEQAFRNNPVIGTLVIPASVTEIGQIAFRGTDISGIEFKDGAELTIGKEAFANAKNLREVTLPSSVVKLNIAAFTYSTNHNDDSIIGLHSLTVPTANPNQITLFETSDNAAHCIVYVPDSAVNVYTASDNWCGTGRFTANNIRAKLTT